MAFLIRMEALGFKSFGMKTKIEFKDGLTVIVGPNGSGKSNINDALKWVLGESSKKSLRAKNANDMIFAGADGFKPSDFAEVTLVFNNEDKLLPIEYEEVSITRRSFRDQEKNEYYINKAQVRRKDIKNLFLDTGLGNTDLSIISQGSVSNISTAKPDELKGFLNEASGVARYQQQKTEAIRKLEKIDQSLDIFEVKLAELNKQVGPLKKQAEKAVKYLEIKKNLEEVELSLIKEQLKVDIPRQNEIEIDNEKFETDRSSTSQKIERIQEQKTHNNTTQLEIDKKLYELQARQQELSLSMSKSMQGTSSSDNLDKQIKQASSSVNEIRVLQETSKDELEEFKTELTNARDVEFNLRINRDKASATLNQIQYEFKKVSGNKYGSLDKGTRSIIENKDSFYGIVGLVSEIVKIAPEYEIAMNSAIGGKLKNVIVEDEQSVKEAIHFLKKNRLGSATFIPANKVKPKTVRSEYLAILETQPGYEGTLGDLIKTNKKYTNVAQSLGGAILVFDNIDSAMEAAKVVDYRYTIATLEGDIIFPGYTVRGGYAKSYNSQNRTGELQEALTNAQAIYDDNNSQYESHISKIDNLRNRIQLSNNESVRLAERASYIETNITKLISQYETLTGTTYDTESLASSDSGSSASIEQISNAIRKLQQAKTAISEKVIIFDKEEKDLRDIWQVAVEGLSENKIELDRIMKSLDSNIMILQRDYQLTVESLEQLEIPPLTMKFEKALSIRISLREDIARLGFVNTDAIADYELVRNDFESLNKNTIDLRNAKSKLLTSIETMDDIMVEQFSKTFELVNKQFSETFKTLFRGGTASIVYTDPDNILDSGIEIVARTPGKHVQNLNLYSGGEKSMIALSLIFAIILVKGLPLLLLDEVEAALDEANVERFAKYLTTLNSQSQIIVVSHRPGTMEQADTLFGVTMQNKGITDIVTVKLDDAKQLVD